MASKLLLKVTPHDLVSKKGKKVTVVGTGAVGMAGAYAMMIENVANNLCLIDVIADKIKGEVMDMQHGEQFIHHTKVTGGTDFALSADSDIIVITAGARQQEGESRLNLVQRNVEIYKEIVPQLVQQSPDCIIIVVSNPVDLMSYVTWKISGLPKHRVIGTGCMLDSARFRYLLGQKLGVSSKSVHGYIIGEHGDSSVPVWSCVNIAGEKLSSHYPKMGKEDDPDNFSKIHKEVVESAYDIIKLKGYTSWAIGLACSHLVKAILSNSHGVYPLSTYVKGVHGIEQDVFTSVPCLVNSAGITHIIQQELTEEETKKLQKSAETLSAIQNDLKF